MRRWQILRTVIEEDDASIAVDQARRTHPRFGEAWDALVWLLAHKHSDSLGRFITVGKTTYRLYKQDGNPIAATPDILVLVSSTEDTVTIHNARIS